MDKKLELFLKAISEPTRMKILKQLKKNTCVGDIWQCLDLPQNLVSHHLKVLKEVGLITSEKCGLKVMYCLDEAVLKDNLAKFNNYLK
jgi:ArsR family transcriptional regulator